jgi:hypothetical protein
MIAQTELRMYAETKQKAEALEAEYKSIREGLIKRVLESEAVENGELSVTVKSFDKTITKYAEVVKGIQEALEAHPELMAKLADLLAQYSRTDHQNRLDVTTQEVQVVTKVKKTKVA